MIELWLLGAGLIGLVPLTLVVCLIYFRMTGRRVGLPSTGVEIVEGKPGSGKSFFLTWWVRNVIVYERRPVYTNLPLKWRVFRWYLRLKGGEKLANLLHYLDEAHFRRFIERFSMLADHREQFKDFRTETGKKLTSEEIDALFLEAHGPHIESGEGANWIPYLSAVCIDEIQWWFPMSAQKDESPALLRYMSMHRHAMHHVRIATQEAGRISINIRKMATGYIKVRNIAEDVFMLGIKFGQLGIRGMLYETYTAEQMEGPRAGYAKPTSERLVLPRLPGNQVIFRLYNSFSHVGGRRRMRRAMEEVRVKAGLLPDGSLPEEVETPKTEEELRREEVHMFKRISKGIKFMFAGTAVLVMGFMAGRLGDPRAGTAGGSGEPVAAGGGSVAGGAAGTGVVVEDERPPVEWPRLAGYGADYLLLGDGSERLRLGEESPRGFGLVAMDAGLRRALLVDRDGGAWLWMLDESKPRPLGRWREVAAYLAGVAAGSGGGGGVGGSGGAAAGTVGAPAGVVDGE